MVLVVGRVDPLGWELMTVGKAVGAEWGNNCPVRKLVVGVEGERGEVFTQLPQVIDRDRHSHSHRDDHPHGVRSSKGENGPIYRIDRGEWPHGAWHPPHLLLLTCLHHGDRVGVGHQVLIHVKPEGELLAAPVLVSLGEDDDSSRVISFPLVELVFRSNHFKVFQIVFNIIFIEINLAFIGKVGQVSINISFGYYFLFNVTIVFFFTFTHGVINIIYLTFLVSSITRHITIYHSLNITSFLSFSILIVFLLTVTSNIIDKHLLLPLCLLGNTILDSNNIITGPGHPPAPGTGQDRCLTVSTTWQGGEIILNQLGKVLTLQTCWLGLPLN